MSPWAKGDVLYEPTREEQIAELKKLTYADVKKFHDQFHGANCGVFAVVGPVDAVRDSEGGGRVVRRLEHFHDLSAASTRRVQESLLRST